MELLFKTRKNESWITAEEAKLRVQRSKAILAADRQTPDKKADSSLAVMNAWSYAKLGDADGVLASLVRLAEIAVSPGSVHQQNKSGEVVGNYIGRILGVLRRQNKKLDSKFEDQLVKSILSVDDKEGSALKAYLSSVEFQKHFDAKDVFESSLTAKFLYAKVMSFPSIDYSHLAVVAYEPSILSEDKDGSLRLALTTMAYGPSRPDLDRKLDGTKAFLESDQLLAASLLGDIDKVVAIMKTAKMSHAPIAVAPFATRGEIQSIKRILTNIRDEDERNSCFFIAVNVLLNRHHLAEARELMKEISTKKTESYTGSAAGAPTRVLPYPEAALSYGDSIWVLKDSSGGGLTSGATVVLETHAALSWLCGRINNEESFQKILQSTDDLQYKRKCQVFFSTGLLEDIPSNLLREASK